MAGLRPSWDIAWRGVGGASDGVSLFAALTAAYAEPQRKYHTLQHLQECLGLLEPVAGLASHPQEVGIGLWFHDAIYDVKRADNEERSAQWWSAVAAAEGVAGAVADRIRSLVLVTKHSGVPASPDEQLLVDIDLAILGAPERRFAEYERQIRDEYAWVAQASFTEKRRAILRSFLDRERIFGTPYFHARFEAAARANLERAVANISG